MPMKPGLEKAAFKESVRPQDDLFRHVNGKWLDETEIPEDKAIHGSFYMLADDSELAVKEILEEASKNPAAGVSQQIGDLYACFMDEEHIESLGAKPLEPELARVDAVATIADLFRLIGELESEGVGGFWGSYVDNDPGNPERYLLHFYQGGLGLPDRDYYFDEKYEDIRKDYLPHLEKMLSLANVTDAAARAKSIYELETKIAQLHWNRVDSRDAEKTYNLHSLQDLKALASGIPWDEYIAALGKGESLLEWNVVMMPSFFEGFAKLASEENLEAMKDALRMDLIRGYAPYLS
ncbi:MAG: peptidase M13, partial [Aquiluna sp.]